MNTKIKILHLEDVQSDALLIQKELKRQKLPCEIQVVDNKLHYIKAITAFSPDIILSDHSLPSYNSFEALDFLQANGLKIPFILLTAAMPDEFAVDILQRGADDYIIKDRLNRLPNAISTCLEKYRLQSEKQIHIDQLVKNERKFRTLIESSNDGILILDADAKITFTSSFFFRAFGYPEAETLAFYFSDNIHPEDQALVKDKIAACKQNPGKAIAPYEVRFKHRDGHWVWREDTLTNMLHDPVIKGIINNCRDISERKAGESSLKESEEKYRSFFENSLDGKLITSPDGRILRANPVACAMFQMTEAEICQAGREKIVDVTDPRLVISLEERQKTGKATTELTFIKKDGTRFLGEINSAIYLNAKGEERTAMTIRDISERKQAEEKLKESEIFNKEVLASLDSHIAVLDENGTIIAVNKAWHDFAVQNGDTYLEKTAVGNNYFEACIKAQEMGDTLAGQALAGILAVHSKEIPVFEMEYPCHAPEEKRWFTMRVVNFGGDLSKMVITHLNISDRKNAEENRLASLKALENAHGEIKKIMDSSWDIICTTNKEGRFINVSAASERILGYSPKEITGKHFSDFVLGGDDIKTREVCDQIMKGQPVTMFENTYLHKNGNLVPLIWSARWDEQDQLMYSIAKDATEKKKLELAFARERQRFQDLLLSAPFSVGMLVGPTHVFEIVNSHYEQLIGRKDLYGKPVVEALPEIAAQGLIQKLNEVYQTGKTFYANEYLVKLDQNGNGQLEDFYLNFTYQAYHNKQNEIQGIFFFVVDVTEQVISRKTIEKSEKQYRQIVETAQEGIWLLDKNDKTIFVNNKMCQVLGFEREEMIGKEISFFMDEEGKALVNNSKFDLKKKSKFQVEYKYISKSNKEVWASVSHNHLFDEAGNYQGALAMIADITEKKNLEKLLSKASQLARIGFYEINFINDTLFWSEVTQEIHEVPADFRPTVEAATIFFESEVSRFTFSKALEEARFNKIPYDLELQIVTLKGHNRWVRVIGEPVFSHGQCVSVYGSIQDIDQVKKAEIKVIDVYQELNTILESIGDGFFAVDKQWTVTYWNKVAEKQFKIKKRNILHKSIDSIFLNEPGSVFWKKFKKAIKKNTAIHFEEYYSPLKIWFDVSAYPSVNGLSVYFKDITERKLADIQLNQLNENLKAYTQELVISNKELEQFSYIVSHNLRAPVANIIGLVNLLLNQPGADETQNKILEGLGTSVERLDGVIMDLNYILKAKKEINERKETVNLYHLVDDIKTSIENLIDQETVQISTDFEDCPELFTIKSYLYSIFYNLISNSIKYRQSGIPLVLKIDTRVAQNHLYLTFRDNGTGINLKKKANQVFGLYRRFHQHIEGKGMGLFMVKTQVEMLGGKISIQSEVNKGTEFSIEFKL